MIDTNLLKIICVILLICTILYLFRKYEGMTNTKTAPEVKAVIINKEPVKTENTVNTTEDKPKEVVVENIINGCIVCDTENAIDNFLGNKTNDTVTNVSLEDTLNNLTNRKDLFKQQFTVINKDSDVIAEELQNNDSPYVRDNWVYCNNEEVSYGGEFFSGTYAADSHAEKHEYVNNEEYMRKCN